GRCFMVDGGGGVTLLHQLKHAGYSWTRMRDIFVTHKHIDHVLGIVWMLRLFCSAMKSGRLDGEVRVHAHDELVPLLRLLGEQLLMPDEAAMLGKSVRLVSVSDGETREIIGRRVTFFDIGSTKTRQFGFAMDYAPDKRLVCLGDEPFHPVEEKYVRGCDWLLHEAFCLRSEADIFHPYEKHHSTVADACELAERMGVKNLLLYHTEDTHGDRRRDLYLAEGQPLYSGRLFVPEELESLNID
ncbi:MAG: MBL fold metallo-hydrolase, partial [Desulfovibrionaceae bacterium]|nr:MBL fold metallo-hydrolase [Desulfovibrionaceae bacterium]